MRRSILVVLLLVGGCEMDDQPRYSALQESGFFADGAAARPAPAHALSQADVEAAQFLAGFKKGSGDIQLSAADRARASRNYSVYCSPCHGARGNGDGEVVKRGFPRPAPLSSLDNGRAALSELVGVILEGRGKSPAFAGTLAPRDAAALALVVRDLRAGAGSPGKESR